MIHGNVKQPLYHCNTTERRLSISYEDSKWKASDKVGAGAMISERIVAAIQQRQVGVCDLAHDVFLFFFAGSHTTGCELYALYGGRTS